MQSVPILLEALPAHVLMDIQEMEESAQVRTGINAKTLFYGRPTDGSFLKTTTGKFPETVPMA